MQGDRSTGSYGQVRGFMNDILLRYRHFVKIVCRLIFDIIPCYIIFIFLQVD